MATKWNLFWKFPKIHLFFLLIEAVLKYFGRNCISYCVYCDFYETYLCTTVSTILCCCQRFMKNLRTISAKDVFTQQICSENCRKLMYKQFLNCLLQFYTQTSLPAQTFYAGLENERSTNKYPSQRTGHRL